MAKIQVMRKDALQEGSSNAGITRQPVFDDEGCQVLRSTIGPGATSGWHHHGDHHVYGYVVSGTLRFESNTGPADAVTLGAGGFLHIPPHTVHREINPSSEAGEVILFLRGTGTQVVNVDG